MSNNAVGVYDSLIQHVLEKWRHVKWLEAVGRLLISLTTAVHACRGLRACLPLAARSSCKGAESLDRPREEA